MPAPSTLAKVRAALKRFYPPALAFQDDASSLGLERGSIGYVLARVNDIVESLFAELFPDTASQLIERWEKVTRVPTRTGDPLATRQSRALSVLRRESGPRIDQLEKMLTASLALDPSDMIWVEGLRQEIELMLTWTATIPTPPQIQLGLTYPINVPWPGVVDDGGVRVYANIDAYVAATTVTIYGADGTSSVIPNIANNTWVWDRSKFTGKSARGPWTIALSSTNPFEALLDLRLLVSNNVDSGQIYNFFVLRDPALAGTADLIEAQRLFHRTALGNMRAFVIETLSMTFDDPHSLMDRDILGA